MNLYRQRVQLADLCVRMRAQGIKIDMVYAADLKANFDDYRALLFPSEKVGRRRVFRYFKPNAPPAQIVKWFKTAGIRLDSTSRTDVELAWNALADESGWTDETPESELPEPAVALRRLHWYKTFSRTALTFLHERWLSRRGFVHPRWYSTANAIGSIECSKPGLPQFSYLGGLVRKSIVPYPGSDHLVEATVNAEQLLYGRLKPVERILLQGCGFEFLTETALDARLRKEDERLFHAIYDWRVAGRIATLNSHRLALRLFGRRTNKARAQALDRARPIIDYVRDRIESIAQEVVRRDVIGESSGHYLRLHGNTIEDRLEAACSFMFRSGCTDIVNRFILHHGVVPVLVDSNRVLYDGLAAPPEVDSTLVVCQTIERWS